MNKSRFLEIMLERKRIWKECQDEWSFGIEKCCAETIDVIKEDIPGFILFLENECSSKDYCYITDWFDEIIRDIKSQELLDAFRRTMNSKFLLENKEYHIQHDLDEAIELFGEGIVH